MDSTGTFLTASTEAIAMGTCILSGASCTQLSLFPLFSLSSDDSELLPRTALGGGRIKLISFWTWAWKKLPSSLSGGGSRVPFLFFCFVEFLRGRTNGKVRGDTILDEFELSGPSRT